MAWLQDMLQTVFVGIGATVVMDFWLILLRHLGVPTLNYAFIGRWVGHLFQGRFMHESIGKSATVQGELALGWLTHYAVGITFAMLLVGLQGTQWVLTPTLRPAIAVGAFTVLLPLLVMQPAMGAGVASSKTATPIQNCLRSLANHTVFGLGLYLSAALMAAVAAVV